jgi:tRNA A37 threonylcarbamoyladenosine biosynthesis protein TsaE
LGELLDEGGVVAIEWGDAVVPVVPSDYLEVRLTLSDVATPDGRVVELSPVGALAGARQRRLAEPSPRGAQAGRATARAGRGGAPC